MRTIEIEGNELKLHGSALTLFYFEEEFDEDMLGKIVELAQTAQSFDNIGKSLEKGDLSALGNLKATTILKVGWALSKTANSKGIFPNFEEWLRDNEEVSPFDGDLLLAIVEEATSGCFPSGRNDGQVSGDEGEEE